MKYFQADCLDKPMSYIGLGTVKLGRNQAVKYPHAFEIPNDKSAAQLIALARELGINVIDTAPAYGNSEPRLGGLLKSQRDDWIIVSKAGEEFQDGRSHYNFTKKHIEDSVKRSLKNLQTDYIDLLLIHSNGEDEKIIQQDGVFETLAELKKQGLIKGYGMSVKTVAGGRLTVDQADAVMVTLNPFDKECEEVLKHAEQQNKVVLIKKAFASGHVYVGEKKLSAQQIFAFLSGYPAISSVITGTINLRNLTQNVEAAFLAAQ